MGRPPLAIPTELLGARIPRPICRRVRAEAKRQGKKLGAFVAKILDQAVPAKKRKGEQR
jgi:predicted HicB family RNase H-like nuclease